MASKNTKLSFVGKVKDLACLGSYVTIHNNTSVLVENCRQICECTDIMAKVSTGDYYIEIWGNDLKMSEYSQDTIAINGTIESVKLTLKSFRNRER